MDPTLITAATAVITSIIGGLCVAVPSLLNARKNAALMEFQLTQLHDVVRELKSKIDEMNDLKIEVEKINVRLDNIEKEVEELHGM